MRGVARLPNQRQQAGAKAATKVPTNSATRRLRVVARPGDADGRPSLPPGPHNIPVRRGDFVGRAREMSELEKLVRSHRLVTVTGPSGIGKTRITLEVTAQVHDRYPNGAWVVELAPVAQPDLVPQALASALGLDPNRAALPSRPSSHAWPTPTPLSSWTTVSTCSTPAPPSPSACWPTAPA